MPRFFHDLQIRVGEPLVQYLDRAEGGYLVPVRSDEQCLTVDLFISGNGRMLIKIYEYLDCNAAVDVLRIPVIDTDQTLPPSRA